MPMQRLLMPVLALLLVLLAACSGGTKPFTYGVRVADPEGNPIPNAKVTVDVAGQPPLVHYTDDGGYVSIQIDTDYAGQPGKLHAEAAGYTRSTQNLTLNQDQLPQEIRLALDILETTPE